MKKLLLTALAIVLLAAGASAQSGILLEKGGVKVTESKTASGAASIAVNGTTIVRDVYNPRMLDDKTIIVADKDGRETAIDLKGKYLLEQHKFSKVEGNANFFVLTLADGTSYAIDRKTGQRAKGVEIDVYDEAVKAWEAETGRVHVDNLEAAAEKVREEKEREVAELQARISARFKEIGYADGAAGQGLYFMQIRGKRVAVGKKITFLTDSPFDRYWFMVVVDSKDVYSVVAVDTENGNAQTMTKRPFDSIRLTLSKNEIRCEASMNEGGPANYVFDGATSLVFKEVAN